MDIMWPISQPHFHVSYQNEIYSLSFLCDVWNEVLKNMQWLNELWWDHNTKITSL